MSPDAITTLVNVGVRVARLPSAPTDLMVAPRQFRKAVDELTAAGWKPDNLTADDPNSLPCRLVLRSAPNHSVGLVASLVADPELRRLFPIRTVDVMHRSGWMFGPVNPVHPIDAVLYACLHHASTGDQSLLTPALVDAVTWGARQRQAFAEIVRRAGAQLPVLIALDTTESVAEFPIAPSYRIWRWIANHSERARRHTRRSTVGSLIALLRVGRHRRTHAPLVGAGLIAAIAREAEAVPRYASHGRWRALLALSTRQLLDASRIVLALAHVEWRLRALPLSEVITQSGVTLDIGEITSTHATRLPVWAQEDARLVERVGRLLLPGNPCLRTSIVIAQRLHQFGPVIRIGVSAADGRFDSAHAWVEVAGMSFGENERFAPFNGPESPPG